MNIEDHMIEPRRYTVDYSILGEPRRTTIVLDKSMRHGAEVIRTNAIVIVSQRTKFRTAKEMSSFKVHRVALDVSTPEGIAYRVEEIQDTARRDPEAAEALTTDLYLDVFREIADGSERAVELARAIRSHAGLPDGQRY